jgi:hypothetical protein
MRYEPWPHRELREDEEQEPAAAGEECVRLAQKMQVGPCIPVGRQL